MTTDDVMYVLVLAAFVPANLFVTLYGCTAKWWRSHIGRSLIISSVGLAALIDISFLVRILGEDYAGRNAARVVAFSLVVLGCWYQLGAFLVERFRRRP